MNTLARLRNIGPKSSHWLSQIGVKTEAQIRQAGPVSVYLSLEKAGFNVSLNMLWALAGIVEDCHWNRLPPGVKESLLVELDARRDAQARLHLDQA